MASLRRGFVGLTLALLLLLAAWTAWRVDRTVGAMLEREVEAGLTREAGLVARVVASSQQEPQEVVAGLAHEGVRRISVGTDPAPQPGWTHATAPVPGSELRVLVGMPDDEAREPRRVLRGALGGALFAGLLGSLIAMVAGAEWLTAPLRDALDHIGRPGPPDEVLRDLHADLGDREHRLDAQQERFQHQLDALPDGLIILDEEHRITLANHRGLALLGLDEDSLGQTATHPALEMAGELGLQGAVVEVENVPLRPGRLVLLRDMTELRRLERVRQDFVANVSHELRTPISVIRTNVDALKAGAMEEPDLALAFLEAIDRNGDRLSALIADLLELARLDGGARLTLGPVDCGLVAWRVRESLYAAAEGRGQQLVLSIPPGTFVQADEGALEQCLTNLVENAIKYGREGGRVELRALPSGLRLRLEVHDNGPGVPQEHRDRIFERFYRVDKGRSRQMGGTGLGLSIVRHLGSSMEAELGVDDSDLGGARFWLILGRPRTHSDTELPST